MNSEHHACVLEANYQITLPGTSLSSSWPVGQALA